MVIYFFRTGMEFSRILQHEEKINLNKAKMLFAFVSLVIIAGKWDLYVS